MGEENPEKEAPEARDNKIDDPVTNSSAEETIAQEQKDIEATEVEAKPHKRTGLIIAAVAIVVLLILT